jgi:hypothetical protein
MNQSYSRRRPCLPPSLENIRSFAVLQEGLSDYFCRGSDGEVFLVEDEEDSYWSPSRKGCLDPEDQGAYWEGLSGLLPLLEFLSK